MIRGVGLCAAALWLLAGCGGEAMLRCENAEAYENAAERPPIQVPDDLSVPDQSEALRIPASEQIGGRRRDTASGPCLESPPRFYEGLDGTDGAPAAEPGTPAS